MKWVRHRQRVLDHTRYAMSITALECVDYLFDHGYLPLVSRLCWRRLHSAT